MTTTEPTTTHRISQTPHINTALQTIHTALQHLTNIGDITIATKAIIDAACTAETDALHRVKQASNLPMHQVAADMAAAEADWAATKAHIRAGTRPQRNDLTAVDYDDAFGSSGYDAA